jgi:hypothetical protein
LFRDSSLQLERVFGELLPSNGLFRDSSLQLERVFGELLPSNGLFRDSSFKLERVFGELLPSNGLFRDSSLQQERMFGELLTSNGLPLWLQYSRFQASCHNIYLQLEDLNIVSATDTFTYVTSNYCISKVTALHYKIRS